MAGWRGATPYCEQQGQVDACRDQTQIIKWLLAALELDCTGDRALSLAYACGDG